MIDYFERIVRLTDLEVWSIRIEQIHYCIVIMDERRKASIEEMELPDAIIDEDAQRTNYVSVSIFSEIGVKKEHKEVLDDYAKRFTNHLALAHCNVVVKFYLEWPEIAVDRMLYQKYGYKLADIPLKKLWHLNQE
ncbi:hypothetical protein [Lysinibacillus sp. NPDC047702]|uniref:hypothetical protein n=1 Tax=unclassified Lysinibacillus TaxID=2636778 RepID=UPI003CFC1DAA